ncbi:MAG: lipid A biosynthesis lauroyl acyltransferase [Sulfuricurvum sp.]|uniref:lipid A biosynthesis lauroyl acyltransferase n=1 Tax=Sulfuricurvum sp. TaxID=2025608 RepID=UPI00261739F3|nr:lipid A biosynthesis lauroyl acyltransferase [Sulfuricurvum sp.]MDD2828849.1 lipid A biosynthesis lauroyl acyltransferase [Sulfuricurvum sp.]MDD4948512.1 lipid A biosynthesis lauroyl acyltransferase [Sulfuricurvum sp.]
MIGYRLFLLFDWCLMHLPKSWRKSIFTSLASLVHHLAHSRNRIIKANVNFAFGESLNPQIKKEIESYCYRNLALNFLQTMENRRNSAEEVASVVSFENRSKVDALLAQHRGIIFVSAHFGNWELGGAALSSLITPVSSIYKEFSTSSFDPYLLEARTNHRMELAEKNGALKHVAKALKNGRSILLMIDQASNARVGVKTLFFGHETYHTSSAASLSAKFNAPIVGVYITSEDEEHYTLRFEEPISVENSDEHSIIEATQKQVNGLEKVIREHPKLWFWCHKRWKGEYQEIYSAR